MNEALWRSKAQSVADQSHAMLSNYQVLMQRIADNDETARDEPEFWRVVRIMACVLIGDMHLSAYDAANPTDEP